MGRFHPAVAAVVADVARRRGLPVDTGPVDGSVEVLVPADGREDLRAELAVGWEGVLAALDPEDVTAVRSSGGRLPGWEDAPDGAWVDRQGRLRVAGPDEEERAADDDRALGPVLVVVGGLALLLAWYTDGEGLRLLAGVGGLGAVLTGLFLPR